MESYQLQIIGDHNFCFCSQHRFKSKDTANAMTTNIKKLYLFQSWKITRLEICFLDRLLIILNFDSFNIFQFRRLLRATWTASRPIPATCRSTGARFDRLNFEANSLPTKSSFRVWTATTSRTTVCSALFDVISGCNKTSFRAVFALLRPKISEKEVGDGHLKKWFP